MKVALLLDVRNFARTHGAQMFREAGLVYVNSATGISPEGLKSLGVLCFERGAVPETLVARELGASDYLLGIEIRDAFREQYSAATGCEIGKRRAQQLARSLELPTWHSIPYTFTGSLAGDVRAAAVKRDEGIAARTGWGGPGI